MTTESRELTLFATNDGTLYRKHALPIMANLRKHIAAGRYDPKKALTLWRVLADAAAQAYTKEFSTPGPNGSYGCFDVQMRKDTAQDLAAYYDEQLRETQHGGDR